MGRRRRRQPGGWLWGKDRTLKLTTIVREGQDRAAVVLDLAVGWDGSAARQETEGGRDPNPPPAGYDRYYLDVGRARDLLTASQSRLRWPAGLTFPETPALGREGQLLPLRLLLAGGPATLAVLGDLVETVRLLAERGDGILAARQRSCRPMPPGCGLPFPTRRCATCCTVTPWSFGAGKWALTPTNTS